MFQNQRTGPESLSKHKKIPLIRKAFPGSAEEECEVEGREQAPSRGNRMCLSLEIACLFLDISMVLLFCGNLSKKGIRHKTFQCIRDLQTQNPREFFVVLGMEPWASHMLNTHSTPEPHPQPKSIFLHAGTNVVLGRTCQST